MTRLAKIIKIEESAFGFIWTFMDMNNNVVKGRTPDLLVDGCNTKLSRWLDACGADLVINGSFELNNLIGTKVYVYIKDGECIDIGSCIY